MTSNLLKFILALTLMVVSPSTNVTHQGIFHATIWHDYTSLLHDQAEAHCIREALYHEARGEGEEGMRAVMSVIYNRKEAKGFPSSYCKVIQQPLQFSYRNATQPGIHLEIKPVQPSDKAAYALASMIAQEAAVGLFKPLPELSDALWYHTKDVKPRWSKLMHKVRTISKHQFFKKKE